MNQGKLSISGKQSAYHPDKGSWEIIKEREKGDNDRITIYKKMVKNKKRV